MFARVLKILGVVLIFGFFLFGAIEFWVYKNRDRIFLKVKEVVNENLHGNLEIEDFHFRPFQGKFGLNFSLENVRLTDTLFQTHQIPFLEAENVHVAVDLDGFYKGDIKIKNLVLENGGLKIFKQKNGYSNLSIFKSDDSTSKEDKSGGRDAIAKRLGNLHFRNFRVTYADSVKENYYGVLFRDASNIITITDSASNSNFTGSVFFEELTFKPEKGGFLVKQETNMALALSYNWDKHKLVILPSTLESAAHDKIGISGEFSFSQDAKKFRLLFTANQIEVDNAVKLLTRRLREQIDSIGVHSKVDTRVRVAGEMGGQMPRVDVHFVTDPFKYPLPVGTINDMKAEGDFTNQSDTTQFPSIWNSRLIAPNLTGKFEQVPFKLNLYVRNFFQPVAKLDGYVSADSTNMNNLLDPARYRFKNGSAKIEFHFQGSLKNFYDPRKDRFNGKLWGKTSVNNISLDYLPRQVHLKNIKGDFTFNEKVFVFPDLHFSDGQNMLYIRGTIVDLIPYLFGSPKPLRANVDINIPSWQLNWLETLLAPKTVQVSKKKKLKLSELLDDAIDKMEIVAKLDSKNMKYHHFSARDVKGRFTISNNAMSIEYFVMRAFAGGNVRVSGQMDNAAAGQLPHVSLKGKIVNANVKSVFASFDDFSQKTITKDNLRGTLSTDFNFESNLTNSVKLIPSTMKGMLDINLVNGYIINFEPFMKMKKLIFKKRNFEEVKLAPIRNHFRLQGQEIWIAPMEIESNVVTLFIDGIYSFGTKTDINIQIPLSNLKKRDSTYVLDPHNPERKEGPKIYLKAIDENGEVNIKLAFRKKTKKNKQEEPEFRPEDVER